MLDDTEELKQARENFYNAQDTPEYYRMMAEGKTPSPDYYPPSPDYPFNGPQTPGFHQIGMFHWVCLQEMIMVQKHHHLLMVQKVKVLIITHILQMMN